MKARSWPRWAIFVQTLGGLTFVAIALAIDDAYRTAELRNMVGPSGPGATDSSQWLSLIYLWPYVVFFVLMFIVIPASVIASTFLMAGLPIRLIPAVRSWWVRRYASVILLAVSVVLLAVAWLALPAAHIETSAYQPSSPLFVIATALGAFAVWHFWLPARSRGPAPEKSAPSPVRVKELDEERRLGRLL